MKHTINTAAAVFISLLLISSTAVTRQAENFAVYDIAGKRSTLYAIIDALPADCLLMLNFTSVNCKPCRKEIPELTGIEKSSKGRAKFICIFSETGDPVKKLAAELGLSGNVYVDPFGAIRDKFSVKEIPVTIVINKKYGILGWYQGYTEANIKAIKEHAGMK